MRVLYTIAAAAAWTLAATTACADGLLYQLPKDGAWAKYDLTATGEGMGQTTQAKGSLRMASVGEVTEQGQPCRWIEVVVQGQSETPGGTTVRTEEVWKVLIPQKRLARGEAPLDHAIRAWEADIRDRAKKTSSAPDKAREARQLKDVKDFSHGPLPALLAGPLKDVKQLGKAEVESKLGKLSCEGVRGVLEFKDGIRRMRITLENRLHPKAPFGVVSSRCTIEGVVAAAPGPKGAPEPAPSPEIGIKVVWDLKLADFGEGAKSELPDAK